MTKLITLNDAQALTLVTAQAYRVNQKVYETKYPDMDFGRLIYVETEGNPWATGVLTYTSDVTGAAKWQSGYAKDVPMADVNQDMQLKTFHMAAIGYQWNIEEINTALNTVGGTLPSRRAAAARLAYQSFMYDVTLTGNAEKGMGGLINYPGVTTVAAAADGTGSSRYWVDTNGAGQKTPVQIVRDFNLGLQGVELGTNRIVLADTVLLPPEAADYLDSTPFQTGQPETIMSWLMRNNKYTRETGQPLTIRSIPALSTASTQGVASKGRMVAYKNSEDYVKLHLPMPHQFLPVYQDGPFNYAVPGIFRTGGVEVMTTLAFRYIDAISEPPAA